MATRYVVNAIFGGTKLSLAIAARSAQLAALKAQKVKQARHATVFVVINRASGKTEFIQPNAR